MVYTPSEKLSVDYFQINGAFDSRGESAIVLLVDTEPTTSQGKKGTVVSAVLIDVGYSKHMLENLVATMDDIKKSYNLIDSKDCLQFDAVIVTHWDIDHYNLLESNTIGTGIFMDPKIGMCKDPTKDDFGRVKSFKYSINDQKKYQPETRFYCQFWGGTYSSGENKLKFKMLDGGPPAGKDNGRDGVVNRTDPFSIWLRMTGDDITKINNALGGSDPVKTKVAGLGYTTNPAPIKWLVPIMKGFCQPPSMLGTNVFSGDQLPSIVKEFYQSVTTPTNLLSQNAPGKKWPKAPGLYIVGVQGIFLGAPFTPDKPTNAFQSQRSDIGQDEEGDINEHHQLGVIDDPKVWAKRTTDTNPLSVVSLLIWDAGTDPNAPIPKISLYTGGDAEWVTEARLCNWLSKDTANPATITCIKAGHHGSAAGTSVEFIKQTQPQHIIFSAGYLYGHPVHQLLLYLDAWWQSKSAGSLPYEARMHSVCYPYWLVKVFPDINLDWPPPKPDPKTGECPGSTYFRSSDVKTSSYEALVKPADGKDGVRKFQQDLQAAYNDWRKMNGNNELLIFQGLLAEFYTENPRMTRATLKASSKTLDAAEKARGRALTALNRAKYENDDPSDIAIKQQTADTAIGTWKQCAEDDWKINNKFGWQTFSLIAPVFANIWNRWSKVGYDHCPIRGQAHTVSIRYLTARFQPNNLEIGYVLTNGTKTIFDPPKTKVNKKAIAVKAVQSQLGGTKRPRPDPEEAHELPLYRLNRSLEQTILAAESVVARENVDSDASTGQNSMDTSGGNSPVIDAQVRFASVSAAQDSIPSFHTICPSTWSGTDQIPVSTQSPRLSNFICGLPSGVLSFGNNQVNITQTTGAFYGFIGLDDSLYSWWTSALPSYLMSSTMMLEGLIQDNSVLNFLFTWSIGFLSGMKPITFSSSGVFNSFQIDHTLASQKVDDQGLFVDHTGFLLALSEYDEVLLSLNNLFDIADMSVPVWMNLVGEASTILNQSTLAFRPDGANGIWFYPLEQLLVQIRFEVQETSNNQKPNTNLLTSILGSLSFLQLQYGTCTITAIRKQTTLRTNIDPSELSDNISVEGQLTFATTITLGTSAGMPSFSTYLTISADSIQIVLQPDGSKSNFVDGLFKWLHEVMDDAPVFDDSIFNNLPNQENDNSSLIYVREISLTVSNRSGSMKITSFIVTFEVGMRFGLTVTENNIPFRLVFSYQNLGSSPVVAFHGSLWRPLTNTDQVLQKLDPDRPVAPTLMPIVTCPQYYISIPAILGLDSKQVSTLPPRVPENVVSAEIEVSNLQMSFDGTLSTSATNDEVAGDFYASTEPWATNTSDFPTLVLQRVEVNIRYTFAPSSAFDVSFSALIILQPKFTSPQRDSATLTASIMFDETAGDSTWMIEAQGRNFNIGVLYSLFPASDNDAVMNVLNEINIAYFDIRFNYGSSGSAKEFVASGILMLGSVELDLFFQYDSSKAQSSTWSFDAKLHLSDETLQTSLGEILGGVSLDLANVLPDFITSFDLAITPQDFLDLECQKIILPNGTTQVIFSIIAKIGDFEFSFFQISDGNNSPGARRRLLRITLDKLPSAPGFPLIDKLEQPFDSMDFIWNDNSLTRYDIAKTINPVYVKNNVPPIVFKDPRTVSSTDPTTLDLNQGAGNNVPPQPNDIALAAGCHFIIVYEENNVPTAILDYKFDGRQTNPTPPPPTTTTNALIIREAEAGAPTAIASGSGASTTWSRTLGPLSISAIKLNYEQGVQKTDPSFCTITFDAKLMLGPVSGILYGFGLRFPMTSIQSFNLSDIAAMISGIGLELYSPPIAIAGMMVKSPNGYAGALSLEIEPYTFLGGGSYTRQSNQSDSVFGFAEVDGPLLELEFATLSGLIAGFGYNEQLTLPTVDNVTSFPFLTPPTQSDAVTIEANFLNANKTWFQAMQGKDWFTAGLTAKAFHVLTVSAAVVLDLDVDVILGVFADCTATIPADAANDAERFAVADIGIVALFDYGKGIFQVEGQLTPKSFILSKDCKLTGGFALCYWFNGSGHEGDWVLSIGGYHSAFKVPEWYPKPKRLAISWPMGDVTISGDAYFAVTPKACMGGGHLHVAYQSGNLSAWFDAFADFLINYSPFYFIASIGVSIGIHYVMGSGWLSKNFDFDFSATLSLHGPPLAGSVTVDWSIISFTIHFGNSSAQNNPLSWTDFQNMLLQPDPTNQSTTRTAGSMQTITAANGLMDDPTTDQVQIKTNTVATTGVISTWTVNGAIFGFSYVALFPISSLEFNTYQTTDKSMEDLFSGAGPIYIKPMHVASPVTSKCTVTIKDEKDSSYQDFTIKPVLKQVPTALWGQYTSATDPSTGASPASLLSGSTDATSTLVMGLNFGVPPSTDNGPFATFSLTQLLYDCTQGMSPPPNLSVQVEQSPAMNLAYQQWLPSMTTGDSLNYPTEYTAEYWASAENAWQNPSQSITNMVSRWCNICGANEGVKFTSTLTEFAATSAPPTSLINNLADLNYLPPLYTPAQPTYSFEILMATWGPWDVTTAAKSKITPNTANNTIQFDPDFNMFGDPDWQHFKELNVTWRAGVTYPQYYDASQASSTPVSWSQPMTSVTLESQTLLVDYSKNLTFNDPIPDNNGRHIYSATYYNYDITTQVRVLSRRSPFLRIFVDRSLYPNSSISDPRIANAKWALTISYSIIGQNGPEYSTVVGGDQQEVVIPPGITPEPKLTIHRAIWGMQDMTDELYALVTYQQTLSFNVNKGMYPSDWVSTYKWATTSPQPWSIMYQYGDEPLQLLVAVDNGSSDGGIDGGLQTIDYNQRPQPDRTLFFNPLVPSRLPGKNNILAIVWGHNRNPQGNLQAVDGSVYDVVGSGTFVCSNESIGFDGGAGYAKSCQVYYQYGLKSSIQCATSAEYLGTPLPAIPFYDDPASPMPGNGLFVQNPLVGGCQIQSTSTGQYLISGVDKNGISIMRAEGTDSTKALIFKADPPVDRYTPPRVQVWDPTTPKLIYQLQLDRNNDIFLFQGPPVSQRNADLRYELDIDIHAKSQLLLSCSSTHQINKEPFILSYATNGDPIDTQIHSRPMRSTLYEQYLPKPTISDWTLTWIPASSSTGPSVPTPTPSRVTTAPLSPAINNWLALICEFFIVLPHTLGVTGFQQEPSIGSQFVTKWWSSLTPSQRVDISQSIAAVVAMPTPNKQPLTEADLFPSRCRVLWRELYEAGHLWNLITWVLMPGTTSSTPINVMGLFSDVSTKILKLGSEQAFINNPNQIPWMDTTFAFWRNGVGFIPAGFDSVASDLSSLMGKATANVTALMAQTPGMTDQALFTATKSALEGWADVLAKADP